MSFEMKLGSGLAGGVGWAGLRVRGKGGRRGKGSGRGEISGRAALLQRGDLREGTSPCAVRLLPRGAQSAQSGAKPAPPHPRDGKEGDVSPHGSLTPVVSWK